MVRVIVPLAIVVAVFLAFVIWRIQVGGATRRAERRQEQRDRDAWVDRMMRED